MNNIVLDTDLIARDIIGAALAVHRTLGAGLRRKIYVDSLAYELELRGFNVIRDASEIVTYRGKEFESGVVIELLVENRVAVVCETVDQIEQIHVLKLLNQIKYSNIKLGFILNFSSKYLRGESIRRVVNGKINEFDK